MKTVNTLLVFFLFLLLISMPFYPWCSELLLTICFILTSIKFAISNNRYHQNKQLLTVLVAIIVLFVVAVASLGVSEEKMQGVANLHTYLPLVALPIILLIQCEWFTKNYTKVLKTFVVGVLIASVICLLLSLWRSVSFTDKGLIFNPYVGFRSQFVYTNLSVFQYTNTFAMMTVFAIAIMLWKLLYTDCSQCRKAIWVAMALCLLIIFLLSSRTNVFALFFVLYFSVGVYYFQTKLLKKSILLVACVTALFVFFQTCNFRVMNLSQTVTGYITEEDVVTSSGYVIKHAQTVGDVNIRFKIWQLGAELISDYWAEGCGIGDYKGMLRAQFYNEHVVKAYDNGYDQHNQFIETWGETGIFGFFVLIGIFIYSLLNAYKTGNYLLFCCLVLLFFNMMFESVFNRYSGSLFFVFALALSHIVKTPCTIVEHSKE